MMFLAHDEWLQFQEAKKPILDFNRNSKLAMGYNSSALRTVRMTKRGYTHQAANHIGFHIQADQYKQPLQENKLNKQVAKRQLAVVLSMFFTHVLSLVEDSLL